MKVDEKFPNIAAVAQSIAQANGAINRIEPTRWLEALEETVGAEGVYEGDLVKLEFWIGTLTKEQRETLADGEQTEIDEARVEPQQFSPARGYWCSYCDAWSPSPCTHPPFAAQPAKHTDLTTESPESLSGKHVAYLFTDYWENL